MSSSRYATGTQAIPTKRSQDYPDGYSSTPGGTLYSTTPGGKKIYFYRLPRLSDFVFLETAH